MPPQNTLVPALWAAYIVTPYVLLMQHTSLV